MTNLIRLTGCLTITWSLGASTASAMWGRPAKADKVATACLYLLGAPIDGMRKFTLFSTDNPLVEAVQNAPVHILRDGNGGVASEIQREHDEKRAQKLGHDLAQHLFEIERRGDVQTIFSASMIIDEFGVLPEGELENLADLIDLQSANLTQGWASRGLPKNMVTALAGLRDAKSRIDDHRDPARAGGAGPVDLEVYRQKRLEVDRLLKEIVIRVRVNLDHLNDARVRVLAYERYEHICATAVRALSDRIDQSIRSEGGSELQRQRLNNNYLTFLTGRDVQILRTRKALAKFDAKLAHLTDANVELLSMANATRESLGYLMDRSTDSAAADVPSFPDAWDAIVRTALAKLAHLD